MGSKSLLVSNNPISIGLYLGLTFIALALAAGFWGTPLGVAALLVWFGITTKCYLMQIPELPHVIDPGTFTPYYVAYWFGPKWAIPVIFMNIYLTKRIQLNNVDDGFKCVLRVLSWIFAVYVFAFLTQHFENVVRLVEIGVVMEQTIFYGIRLKYKATLPTGLLKSWVVVWPYFEIINSILPIAMFSAYYAVV